MEAVKSKTTVPNLGSNYPYVFLAYGLGGIVGPQLGGVMKDLVRASGDVSLWLWAFIPAGLACLLGAAIMWTLRRPRQEMAPSSGSAVSFGHPRPAHSRAH